MPCNTLTRIIKVLKMNCHSHRLWKSLIHISHLERQKKAQLSCDGSRKVSVSLVTPFPMAFETTYPWQLGYHNSHQSQKIDDEICQIVMRVVSTE